MPSGRPTITASLDEDTDHALRAWCDTEGVSLSAIVEALARAVTSSSSDRPPRWITQALREARAIDVGRRRRA